jgi:transposase
MQELSDHQRRVLLNNPNVEKITEKHVIYKSSFKIKAVEKYLKGQKPDEIFKEAEINPKYFMKKYCQSCIKRWKKKYFDQGRDSLKMSQTGRQSTGRPKSINTDEMTMEELKAIVEIQHEVIDMLKKNRTLAKKRKEE